MLSKMTYCICVSIFGRYFMHYIVRMHTVKLQTSFLQCLFHFKLPSLILILLHFGGPSTLCYGHNSCMGTVRRLYSYDFKAPERCLAGDRNNRTIKGKIIRYRKAVCELVYKPEARVE